MPRRGKIVRRLVTIGMMALTWNLAGDCAVLAGNNLEHGLIYYGGDGTNCPHNATIAERYSVGVCGLQAGRGAQEIKSRNPDFRWFTYNSVTDNYIDGRAIEEHEVLQAIALEHGWNPEIGYLHYIEDTTVRISGDTVFVPAGGRVPVYFSNLSRRACHFSTPQARQLHKEVLCTMTIDRTFPNTHLHPDGIFLDNCAFRGLKTGTVLSGGHVAEAPGNPLAGSDGFKAWHWEHNLGPFLTALKDTLESMQPRRWLMNNTGGYWDPSYVTMDVADILFLEFEYTPLRVCGKDKVYEIWQHDRTCADAGITFFYSPTMDTERPPHPGQITYAEALLGAVALTLTTRTEKSLLYIMGTNSHGKAGWDSLTWRGCIDVVKGQLGLATAAPYAFAEGVDPAGYAYRVWARDYENGLVLVRNRGAWNQGCHKETAVSIALPERMTQVLPSGEISPPAGRVTLRNGTAAILLRKVGGSGRR